MGSAVDSNVIAKYTAFTPNQNGVQYVGSVNVSQLPPESDGVPVIPAESLENSTTGNSQLPVGHTSNITTTFLVKSSPNNGTSGDPPIQTYTGFYGIDQLSSLNDPPDVQMAVGPTDVMQIVNTLGEIWTKQGSEIETFSYNGFFAGGLV